MAQANAYPIKQAGGTDSQPAKRTRNSRGSLARVSSNLALLSAAVALVALWILYYTDWSLIIGGLAGVVGVFALLSKVVTEIRRKQLQRAFEARFLAQPIATWVASALLVSLVVLTFLSGTVMVRSFRDDSSRSLSITRPNGLVPTRVNDVLSGRSGRKFRLWRGFGSGRELRVKLSGLPAASIQLSSLERKILDAPDDFLLRPVVLVRPTPMLNQLAAHARLWLMVEREKNQHARIRFSGKAVWIGCDADVIVPLDLKSRWQFELMTQNLPVSSFEGWLPPTAQPVEWILSPGDQLRISIQTEQGMTYGQPVQFEIPRVDRSADFPLEVVLDVPHGG